MYAQVEKPKENKSRTVTNSVDQKKSNVKQGFGIVDNRTIQVKQRKTSVRINPIQRYPTALSDDEKAFSAVYPLHKSGLGEDGLGKEEDTLTAQEITEISAGVYALTKFGFGEVACNCFAWALGLDEDTGDKGTIYNWKDDHGGNYNFTEHSSGDATIILWGDKKNTEQEDFWDVGHASVKLTHNELLERSGNYKGLKITKNDLENSGIPDPFWSSATGMGLGIFVHPRNWPEGGDYGTALKGMT